MNHKYKVGDRVVAYNPKVKRWEHNPTVGEVKELITRVDGGIGYLIIADSDRSERKWSQYLVELEAVIDSPLYKALS